MPETGSGNAGLVSLLVGFTRALRAAGLSVGTGDALTHCRAMAALDPTNVLDVYWSGRSCLVTRREDIPTYDEVFRAFFLGEQAPGRDLVTVASPTETQTSLEVPLSDPSGEELEGEEALLGLMASNVETLKHRSFADATPDELAALRRIMARIQLTPPRRRTRRSTHAPSGRRPDLRRTVRASLRTHGELVDLYWQRRRVRLRPLVLILDISGSMSDYSRALLQFAHTTKRAAAKVEVFCFGTRLTRITKPLATRRPDDALAAAADVVVDWEGGTRIGDSLDEFVRGWGRRGTGRGGVVVVCSDGLDRGDPEVLHRAMQRLSRQCYRIVWCNPHSAGDPGYRPQTLGMAVAHPHVDVLLSGHDLASLESFAELLPRL